MKPLILSLLLVVTLSINAFSQLNGNYNYGIAVKAFSVMQMPKVFNQNSQRYLNSYLNGGMIKFNDNQISYRLSGNYLHKTMIFNDDCNNCDLAQGTVTDYAFKLGFEKNFNYSIIQPYFAFDIGYRYNRFKGELNSINVQKLVAGTNQLEATKNGITGAPTIGIKFNPVEFLTIFAEGSLEFYYSYERKETVAQDASAVRTYNKTNQMDYLLNPISIGIQINLSSKN